jgi:hypothetical protein
MPITDLGWHVYLSPKRKEEYISGKHRFGGFKHYNGPTAWDAWIIRDDFRMILMEKRYADH